MFEIKTDFEGANAEIIDITENKIKLDVSLRDTEGDWFFWCFKVTGAGGRTLTFEFENRYRVGYFGAAVSYDLESWRWQYNEPVCYDNSFTYTFAPDENEVYFAHDMVYRPGRFFDFARRNNIEVKTLCVSEKGRNVPYIDTEKGDECILLTARHHACESTGNYVLEGVLEEALQMLSGRFRIICVPFIDYDGVIAGDQGKNRNGHDHNRDYDEKSVYASVLAIRKIVENNNIRFAFDFHSPWHCGGENDTMFIPMVNYSMLKNITRFSHFFEQENCDNALPFYAKNNIHPDIDWNKSGSPNFSTFTANAGAELAFALETAYFMVSGTAFSADRAASSGKSFIRALSKYLERDYRIAIAGDLLYENPMNELCKTADGYDYRQLLLPSYPDLLNSDFLVVNPETTYAGEGLGYTKEKYCFNTPEEALFTLKRDGFDLITLANNHCMDRGEEGIKSTCLMCERAKMDYIGISKGERNAVFIKDIGDRRVAFVNATYGTNAFSHLDFLKPENRLKTVALTHPEETREGSIDLLVYNEEIQAEVDKLYNPDSKLVTPYLDAIKGDIEFAKDNSDYVIMLLHSGGQYNKVADPYTKLVCERIKAMGADMIIANHPHIILPAVYENGYFITYSTGNLQSVYAGGDKPCSINPDYSVLLYLDFESGKKEPKISFSVMKIEADKDFKKPPKTYNTFDLFDITKDEALYDEALQLANWFMPSKNYTNLARIYHIN